VALNLSVNRTTVPRTSSLHSVKISAEPSWFSFAFCTGLQEKVTELVDEADTLFCHAGYEEFRGVTVKFSVGFMNIK